MKLVSTFLLLFSIIAAGCSGGRSAGGYDETIIVPLAVGTAWTYRVTSTHPDGGGERMWTESFSVTGDSTIAGEKWSIVRGGRAHSLLIPYDEYEVDTAAVPELFVNRKDGLWMRKGAWLDHVFNFPARLGDTIRITDSKRLYVVALDTPISVPAGTFRCVQVREGAALYRTYRNYAPGVGLVSIEYGTTDSTGHPSVALRYELSAVKIPEE